MNKNIVVKWSIDTFFMNDIRRIIGFDSLDVDLPFLSLQYLNELLVSDVLKNQYFDNFNTELNKYKFIEDFQIVDYFTYDSILNESSSFKEYFLCSTFRFCDKSKSDLELFYESFPIFKDTDLKPLCFRVFNENFLFFYFLSYENLYLDRECIQAKKFLVKHFTHKLKHNPFKNKLFKEVIYRSDLKDIYKIFNKHNSIFLKSGLKVRLNNLINDLPFYKLFNKADFE